MSKPAPRVEGVSRSSETLLDLSLSRGTLDRAAELRKDPDLLSRLLGDRDTLVLELAGGSAEVEEVRGEVALHLRPPHRGDLTALGLFLGRDEDGRSYVAVVGDPVDEGEPREWRSLRDVAVLLSDRDSGLFTTALALANWHAKHTHCPRCGSATTPQYGGWVRRCTNDGTEHYPRTDPAVIMSVVDADDRLLLGRGPQWGEARYSVLAGFVEPGESLEAAVAREVQEEVGVSVEDVRYLGNQPWPFPCSLMVGFTATAKDTAFRLDEDEIVEAIWVSREELARGVQEGRIGISPRLSIARRLIEHWYGGEIDQPVEWTAPNRPTEQKG
jgi:NAD+ diphosphatase